MASFRAIDFSEWEDKQGNGDRDDAVAKGNNSVYAWVSFACRLVTPPFSQILGLSTLLGVIKVGLSRSKASSLGPSAPAARV